MALSDVTKGDRNAAAVTRYATLTGLVLLICHLVHTWRKERRLIWSARASFTKYAFLVYRYLLPACLVFVFISQSGFSDLELSDSACGIVIVVLAVSAAAMQALGNGLAFYHVVDLWEYNKKVIVLALLFYIGAYGTTIVVYVVALVRLFDQIRWHPILDLCVFAKLEPLVIVAFVGPVVFKVVMVAALLWNVIDRPRQANSPVMQSLRTDGIYFYVIHLVLVSVQLAGAATQDPRVFMPVNIFSWTLSTLAVNRMIFALRQREVTRGVFGSSVQTNSLSLAPLAPRNLKSTGPAPSAQIELSRVVEVELSKD